MTSSANESGECRRYCPSFHHTVELLGRRWNGVILHTLMGTAGRFGEIRAVIPGLSDRLLAERLRELEGEGLVSRRCSGVSGAPRYQLTAKGRALEPVIDAIALWAAEWTPEDPSAKTESLRGGNPATGTK
ncbi:winged helix-turn-helix transcriptional regulator [Nocardioides coralli]|uniref:winged helix-turn-helix transcriptional regulator n=1 Tax=Nocardioides coralli TaxID=2872154 RepID=UPI001CA454B4|nr:helix-turn-helix transcriptional regulator [Nocardioides coralli]